MSESNDKPLLTFAICAFRQERFIQEAVAGALAQTYSPLEIILSDDCSEDRTFDIMREMAAAYRGPHRLVLNRNPARLSIGGHVNRIVELAHGEMIIGTAGDDVSLPQRTEVVCRVWAQTGKQATSIHSNYIQIDADSQVIERVYENDGLERQTPKGGWVNQKTDALSYVHTLEPTIHGCTHAFAPRLFKIFGPLPEQVIYEDKVIGFRSVLAGEVIFINEPLVKYRLHDNNIYVRSRQRALNWKSLQQQEDRVGFDFRNRETMYDTFRLDLERAKPLGLIERADCERAAAEAARLRRRYSLMGQFLESGLCGKFRILSTLRREGLSEDEAKVLVRRLLPRSLRLPIRLARSYAGRLRRDDRRRPARTP